MLLTDVCSGGFRIVTCFSCHDYEAVEVRGERSVFRVSTQNLKWTITSEKKSTYKERNLDVVFGILDWILNSPVDHTRWASLSEGEASRGVCGRFRIHGGRRGRVWPTCRGWRSFTGTTRCSVSRMGVWKKHRCQLSRIDECTPHLILPQPNFFFFFFF